MEGAPVVKWPVESKFDLYVQNTPVVGWDPIRGTTDEEEDVILSPKSPSEKPRYTVLHRMHGCSHSGTRAEMSVALKFIWLCLNGSTRDPKDVLQAVSTGLMRRSRASCLPGTVCILDCFFYEHGADKSIYLVVVTELMHGPIIDLCKTDYVGNLRKVVALFGKCCQVVRDLERLKIYDLNIKASNFLHKDGGGVIKLSDAQAFDACEVMGPDGMDALRLKLLSTSLAERLVTPPFLTDNPAYEPPEMLLLSRMCHEEPERYVSVLANSVKNDGWLSMMSAYKLVSLLRFMLMMAGFNRPLFDPQDNSYPKVTVSDPLVGGERYTCDNPERYIQFNGAMGWPTIGSKTILSGFSDEDKPLVERVNEFIAGVMAPGSEQSPHHDLVQTPRGLLCSDGAKNNRPDVGQLCEMASTLLSV